jgi:hypothetical protein
MEYFAGLDISMEETHLCVVDRDGGLIHQAKALTTPEAIVAALNAAPACRRVVFETGRMAPMLYHGLQTLGVPVICIESRQAYQALKSLATHKTDRNDARGLAHLARTGFYKPVHVKSLPAHAIRSLIIARKKLVGQRVTLENQIRGLAVVFGVRLPRALSPAFIEATLRISEGLGHGDRPAIDDAQGDDAQGADRAGPPPRHHHARHAATRHRVPTGITPASQDRRLHRAPVRERRPREGLEDGADSVACGHSPWPIAVSTKPPQTQLTPSSAYRARRERRHPTASLFAQDQAVPH